MVGTAHVIGAGLSGLAASCCLAEAGVRVVLHEAGPAAGGRCRSFVDRALGVRIDNGNHLLLSGNHAAMAYLARIGTTHALTGPAGPDFPFLDLESGERWTLRLSRGPLPLWVFDPARRLPGSRARDYLALLCFGCTKPEARIAEVLGQTPLYARLISPLAIAALNTNPREGSARLFATVLRETVFRGRAVPRYPAEGLSETFIDPALAWLKARGAEVRFNHRIVRLEIAGGRVSALTGPSGPVALGSEGAAVLAVPAPVAADLLPGLTVPDRFQPILNLHFLVQAKPPPGGFLGLIGGTAEWVFVRPHVVSVTISAAERLIDEPAETLAERVWPEVARALGIAASLPLWRVVKERRASFAATPAQERRRPGPQTALSNLVLAGDWTATALPGTIEGAIRSGNRAAALLLRRF